jgi:hypothetical protein
MHLIWENLLPNLMHAWTNADNASEGYHIRPKVWQAIWQASKDSHSSVPSTYGPCMPNSLPNAIPWTADLRSFWTMFLGPVLLRRRFQQPRFYTHFIELVKLLSLCLQFDILREEISTLRTGFAKSVEDYERCVFIFARNTNVLTPRSMYYKRDPARLAMCPVTIHALLHIADNIEATGPVWCTWAFPMERFCGRVQTCIKSRCFPYSNIDSWLVDSTHLLMIKLQYNIFDELLLSSPPLEHGICLTYYSIARYILCSVSGIHNVHTDTDRLHQACPAPPR